MKLRDGGEIYSNEEQEIQKLAQFLQDKWYFRPATKQNLEEFATEAKGRYLELGYVINVDITPALVGVGAPDIAIVKKVDFSEPDHDRLREEAKKQLEAEGKLKWGKLKRD